MWQSMWHGEKPANPYGTRLFGHFFSGKCDTFVDKMPILTHEVSQICKKTAKILQNQPQNNKKTVISDGFSGADGRIWTGDLILTKVEKYGNPEGVSSVFKHVLVSFFLLKTVTHQPGHLHEVCYHKLLRRVNCILCMMFAIWYSCDSDGGNSIVPPGVVFVLHQGAFFVIRFCRFGW